MTSRLSPASYAVAALATAALVTVGSPAFAGKTSSGVAMTTNVTGGSVAVTSVVGSASSRIASTACTIDGVDTGCGTFTNTAKTTTYHATVSGLAAGQHEYYQVVFFTDGSLTQASTLFQVR
jgi:hypothetical protein